MLQPYFENKEKIIFDFEGKNKMKGYFFITVTETQSEFYGISKMQLEI